MSNTFQQFWGAFAHYNNPNGAVQNDKVWPEYNAASDLNILLDFPTSVQKGLREEFCDFWDKLLPPAKAADPQFGAGMHREAQPFMSSE
jgi:para-nitrobenzyl esterase